MRHFFRAGFELVALSESFRCSVLGATSRHSQGSGVFVTSFHFRKERSVVSETPTSLVWKYILVNLFWDVNYPCPPPTIGPPNMPQHAGSKASFWRGQGPFLGAHYNPTDHTQLVADALSYTSRTDKACPRGQICAGQSSWGQPEQGSCIKLLSEDGSLLNSISKFGEFDVKEAVLRYHMLNSRGEGSRCYMIRGSR